MATLGFGIYTSGKTGNIVVDCRQSRLILTKILSRWFNKFVGIRGHEDISGTSDVSCYIVLGSRFSRFVGQSLYVLGYLNMTNLKGQTHMNTLKKQPKPRSSKKTVSPYFSICYTNIRGLLSNFSEVQAHLDTEKPDLFTVSESGLDHLIQDHSSHVPIPGYSKIHTKGDPRKGHGLAAYIKDGFPCGRVSVFEDPNAPFMCFRVSLAQGNTFIFTLYRPQNDGVHVFQKIAENIDSILLDYPFASFHIFGDFNVHNKEWLIHSNKTSSEGRFCHDFALCYGLEQIIDVPTRVPDISSQFPNLLDLFLTSIPDKCSHTVAPPLGSSDHATITVKIDARCKESTDMPFYRTVYRYAKADWDGLRNFMSDAPLSHFFNKFNNVSEITNLISDWITTGIDIFIPSKRYQQRPGSQPWFTPECAAAIASRNFHFNQYKKDRSSLTRIAELKIASNKCRSILRNAKSGYAASIQNKIGNEKLGSREFWRITKKVMGNGKGSIPTIINGPEVIASSSDKAKLFASNFSSNSTLDDQGHSLPDFPPLTDNYLSEVNITARDVGKLIDALDTTKSTGPDNIPSIVLKKICPEVAPILAKLFNRCLREKHFPDSWKISNVCPVYKNSGDQSSPSQYRPISLLSIISKLLESIINKRIMHHLLVNSLLSDQQYGFRSCRSTADVLTVITHRVSEALDNGHMTKSIALDISKAFDKVWHKGLLHKLLGYGINGNVFGLIKSFLSNRYLRVVVDGQKSETFSINAGVPQGSILGPTLFLLYINDLPNKIIRTWIDIYADDTSLYGSTSKVRDEETLCGDLSSDLKCIVSWGKEWLVTFNASKTKLMSFHHRRTFVDSPSVEMNDIVLNETPCLDRFLGLKITPDLKWNSYITSVSTRAGKMVGSFYRSREYFTQSAILYLYKSQIRPTMEYCCHIWAGASLVSLSCLDKIQNRLRPLVGDALFSKLEPLSHRRNVASLSLLYRYYYGKCSEELHSLVPVLYKFPRRTRFSEINHPHYLSVPIVSRKFHEQSFFPRTIKMWNLLPTDCFPVEFNLNTFKSRVNLHLRHTLCI